ncbi:A disintegrin and metalloproteinase with thrombospondin motifs 8 [Crotalus adamanteus]|uniref:A disintegrin and metalloproteinase with thrombospondin motifs 8 n=1 Tax=Crotalus adamanteus TaxID=8729 RepID=A0AAW1AZ65_CROAD
MPLGRGRQVSFSITAFGKVLLLQLEPDASFLAPGLKIQHVGLKIQHVGRRESIGFLTEKEEEEEDVKLRRCFYSGTVNAQPDSLVAVSLCQGIHGSFFVDGDKYVIQPQNRGSKDPLMQVHQIQKRSWSKEAAKDMRGGEAQLEPNSTTLHRAKRFTSQARYVETLLVADTSMVQFYGHDLMHDVIASYILLLLTGIPG